MSEILWLRFTKYESAIPSSSDTGITCLLLWSIFNPVYLSNLMKVIYILVICIALGIFLQFSSFYQNHHYSNFTWNQGLKSYLVDLPQYICT